MVISGVKPAAVVPGWEQRAALGYVGCGMLPSCCPSPPEAGTHGSLLSLLQGPALGPF